MSFMSLIAGQRSLTILRMDEVNTFSRRLQPNDALHWSDDGNKLTFWCHVEFFGGI